MISIILSEIELSHSFTDFVGPCRAAVGEFIALNSQIKNLKTKIEFLCLQLQTPSTDKIWPSNINQCLVYNSQFELSSRSYF